MFAAFSLLGAVVIFVTSIQLIVSLRKVRWQKNVFLQRYFLVHLVVPGGILVSSALQLTDKLFLIIFELV